MQQNCITVANWQRKAKKRARATKALALLRCKIQNCYRVSCLAFSLRTPDGVSSLDSGRAGNAVAAALFLTRVVITQAGGVVIRILAPNGG
jgi:hypothetical protein